VEVLVLVSDPARIASSPIVDPRAPGTIAAPSPRRTVGFVEHLATHGGAPALLTGTGAISYRALVDRVATFAAALGPVRRLVLLACSNDVDVIVAYLAALHGGHPVLLAAANQPHHVQALVERYDPDVVIGTDERRWRLDERRSGTRHDLHPELALLLCTSGSTGSSKVVRLSHENLQANAEAIASYLDIGPDDRAVTSLPMSYCYGLSVIHSHLLRGAGIIVTDRSVVDVCFWQQFTEHRGTTLAGVPHTFDLLDRTDFGSMRLPHLRYVTQAGGRMQPDRVKRYADLGRRSGWHFVVMYGQTEATARMAYLPPELTASRPEAIGVPIPGGSFEIDADAGVAEGELVFRGPNVMLGYAESPSDLATGRVIDRLPTGDIARKASDGLYEIVGRKSRFVKLFGLRIDLDQVERSLGDRGHAVLCAGNDEHIVVATTDCGSRDAIEQSVISRFGLATGAVRVLELDTFPRLGSGKPDYASLLELARAQASTEERAHTSRTEAIGGAFAAVFGPGPVDDRSTFVSLGGDSLSYVEVSVRLEEALGYVPPSWHTTSIAELKRLPPQRRALRSMDTTVVLRALAIVLVVGSHVGSFGLRGGAHVLLAVAGYNYARFQLARGGASNHLTRTATNIGRIAVPSVVFIGLVFLFVESHTLANVALVNNYFADGVWRYWYWFVEVLVHVLMVLALLFAVPAVRRAEQRQPYWFATGFLMLGLVLREISMGDPANQVFRTHSVFWLFALGWVAQRAGSRWQRVGVSVAAVLSVPGFFAEPAWDLAVVAGLLVVVWVPTVRVPVGANRVIGVLAAASLSIYLTHWQVHPLLTPHLPPTAVAGLAIVIGVVAWAVLRVVTTWLERGRAALGAGRSRGRAGSPAPVS
jgi:acyl-CoA synthetase (AMP-forming)/AMP-acid ligase II/peptidoglycan/LPS O-acetylase OafA/YrhL